MMQLHDQLSRKCIVTLVPSLMVLSDIAVVLSYIHIDSLLGSALCSSVPLSTLNSLQPMWPWAPNCLAWKIFGMEFLWVQYIYNISFVFLYQEQKRGVTLLPVSELLGRKGPLTRQLFTVFLWAFIINYMFTSDTCTNLIIHLVSYVALIINVKICTTT